MRKPDDARCCHAAHLSPVPERSQQEQRGQQLQGHAVSAVAFHTAAMRIRDAALAQQFAQQLRESVAQQAQRLHAELQAGLRLVDGFIAEQQQQVRDIEAAAPARRSSGGRLTNNDRDRIASCAGRIAALQAQRAAFCTQQGQAAMDMYRNATQQLARHPLVQQQPLQQLLQEVSASYIRLAQGEQCS